MCKELDRLVSCIGCKDAGSFEPEISFAFQPIIDAETGVVFAQEALVRGESGQGAASILSAVNEGNRYVFDQKCRTTAIEHASRLKVAESNALLSINFLPNAVYEPRACIRSTLLAAMKYNFPTNRIMFEFTETEKLDTAYILNILRSYRDMGFKTAIDDFGSGYAGFDMLTGFQPDYVKLDMEMVRDIDRNRVKQIILKHTLAMLEDLGIKVICEGIETLEEYQFLRDLGVTHIQGYLIAKPCFEALAAPHFPEAHDQSKRLTAR